LFHHHSLAHNQTDPHYSLVHHPNQIDPHYSLLHHPNPVRIINTPKKKLLITTLPPSRRIQRENQTNNPSPSSSRTCIKTKIQKKKITENLHSQ